MAVTQPTGTSDPAETEWERVVGRALRKGKPPPRKRAKPKAKPAPAAGKTRTSKKLAKKADKGRG